MEKKVSIKDVANLAGVSVSTVSRVLNNGSYVSQEKRKSIMDAVEQLGFRPNYFAKSLKAGVSKIIALVVPNLNNPVYALISQGVESEARDRGYNVILCNTDENTEIELKYIELLKDRNVDGFVFATDRDDAHHIADLIKTNTSVVDVMRYSMGVNAVTVDNYRIGYEAAMYLINRGHKKIFMFTGDSNIVSFRLRAEGYIKALADNGIPYDEKWRFASSTESEDAETLSQTVVDAIERNGVPDAIFCVNWLRALGVYSAAKRLKLRIPEDISVMGVDDLEFIQFLNPPLTTVSQPFYEMGKKAADTLISEINQADKKKNAQTFMHLIMPTEIIERESVAIKSKTV